MDNVTVSNSARYGIKVKGTLEITNTANYSHALSVSGSGDHAIDVESGGVVTCEGVNASGVNLSSNKKTGLHVHSGGSAVIPGITE